MSKWQFWTLNVIGALTVLAVALNAWSFSSNRSLAKEIQAAQADPQLQRVPQLQNVSRNLVVRIANASRNDKQLRDLLAKYNLQVNFDQAQNGSTPAPSQP